MHRRILLAGLVSGLGGLASMRLARAQGTPGQGNAIGAQRPAASRQEGAGGQTSTSLPPNGTPAGAIVKSKSNITNN